MRRSSEVKRIMSLHAYQLREGADPEALVAAFQRARREGLFQLPGLLEARLLRGIRGERQGQWAALWIYESKGVWEELWGPVGDAHEPERYPERWRRWEGELLEPLLDRDPDKVTLTSYEEIEAYRAGESVV